MTRELRYVCLSDLHLGGRRSLLTDRPEGGQPAASTVLRALTECIRSLVTRNGDKRPILVLNGDVMELALASDEYSAIVFQQFMELVMAPGDELFSEVWFLPGNHDHHLWEAAREAQYADFLLRHPEVPVPHPMFSTRMLRERETHPTTSPLLTALLRRAVASATGTRAEPDQLAQPGPAVSVIYPNLAVTSGDRCVVFHHGHYIEPAYQLMTTLNAKLFGAPLPTDVNQLEEGNFAWIDFFWSALGRSGQPGASVQYVYDRLRDPVLRAELIDTLSRSLAITVRNRTPLGPVEDEGQRLVLHFLLSQLAHYADTLGRQAYYGGATVVDAHDRGLEEYLSRYVHTQLSAELGGTPPAQVTFVLGHTHHPLVRYGQQARGFDAPLAVFNTGGWVHETGGLRPQVGASIVLVDSELDVAAIELYREIASLGQRYPRVQAATESGSSPLAEQLAVSLGEDPGVWQALSGAIAERLGDTG